MCVYRSAGFVMETRTVRMEPMRPSLPAAVSPQRAGCTAGAGEERSVVQGRAAWGGTSPTPRGPHQ